MNRIFLFFLLVALAFPMASRAAGVPVKSYAVPLNRNVAPLAIEGFSGAPISIVGTLPEGQDFTGLVSIQAELHATQTNSETPLAVSDTLSSLPTGRTVTLTFTSAKMNRAKGKYFLSIYATFAASRLEVFRVAEIRLTEGAASQLTPPAPAPPLYAPIEDLEALQAIIADLTARIEELEAAAVLPDHYLTSTGDAIYQPDGTSLYLPP